MKLEKAIEILTRLERTLAPTMAASGTDAIRLGIEALQTIQLIRHYPFPDGILKLPGETKE